MICANSSEMLCAKRVDYPNHRDIQCKSMGDLHKLNLSQTKNPLLTYHVMLQRLPATMAISPHPPVMVSALEWIRRARC